MKELPFGKSGGKFFYALTFVWRVRDEQKKCVLLLDRKIIKQ